MASEIMGMGTIEVLPDGFGFLRSPREPTISPAPTTSMSRPTRVRKFGLRTGDTVEGEIRAPKDGERYFALTRLISGQFRRSGRGPPPRQFRQPHPALSRRAS